MPHTTEQSYHLKTKQKMKSGITGNRHLSSSFNPRGVTASGLCCHYLDIITWDPIKLETCLFNS